MDCQAPLVHGMFPGKNIRVGCHALLQGIFLTQGQNLYLCKQILYHWATREGPGYLMSQIEISATYLKGWKTISLFYMRTTEGSASHMYNQGHFQGPTFAFKRPQADPWYQADADRSWKQKWISSTRSKIFQLFCAKNTFSPPIYCLHMFFAHFKSGYWPLFGNDWWEFLC